MGMGLGGFQEANQLPMFQEFTKYQGHVNNPKRMAEYTGALLRPRDLRDGPDAAQHPARLLLRRDHLRDPEARCALERGAGGEKSLERGGRAAGAGEVPGDPRRRRRGDGRRGRGVQGAGRAARRAGGQQLPAQRLLPRQPPAVGRPARLPGLQGGDEADRAGRRGDRARLAPGPLRHAAAARPRLLAEGREDHPDRRRPHRSSAWSRRSPSASTATPRRRPSRCRSACEGRTLACDATKAERADDRSRPRRTPGRRSSTTGRTSATRTAST